MTSWIAHTRAMIAGMKERQHIEARADLSSSRIDLRFELLLIALLLCGCGSNESRDVPLNVVDPPEITPALEKLLNENDGQFDEAEQMLVTSFRSPGYHSRIKSGTRVHPTRESLIYALGLLQRNRSRDVERAENIIQCILSLQDSDPDSPTFGVWPWLLEEPLAEMESPDPNWANFCGSQLAHILVEHHMHLSSELQESMRASLRRAVQAIQRRDVQPGYTNIAILGGSVCVVAGELLGDAERLAAAVRVVGQRDGGQATGRRSL
jgi:hypothetical protein